MSWQEKCEEARLAPKPKADLGVPKGVLREG